MSAILPPIPSASNFTADPSATLRGFTLADLAQYTPEKVAGPAASKDVMMYLVGKDDVHDIFKYLLSRASVSIIFNMYGFDDDELNQIAMAKILDPNVYVQITLDESQAGGRHEKALLDADRAQDLKAFQSHVAIGQSATHSISHTKAGVLDGLATFVGSTNWSRDGEGTFILKGQPGGPGYKAQNNTLDVILDREIAARFTARLNDEHNTAQKQMAARAAAS